MALASLSAISVETAAGVCAAGYLGKVQHYTVDKNDSLIEIARTFNVGYNSIIAANPKVDPFLPKPGTIITVPTAWILPKAEARPGVVVNLAELRLYYFPRDILGEVVTYPLGIGDEGKETPTGKYTVIQKMESPNWHVPHSIRVENPRAPKVMPPGPENPLGSHAVRLSHGSILIHGTNRPWGIGRRSSHGCLRLYPEDIGHFFRLVKKGTIVTIIDQAVKIRSCGARVFIEVHPHERKEATVGEILHQLAREGLVPRTDFRRLINAVEGKTGVPTDITLDP